MTEPQSPEQIAYLKGITETANLVQSLPGYQWEGVAHELKHAITLGPEPLIAAYLRGSLVSLEKWSKGKTGAKHSSQG